jgi:allantoinase
MEHPVSDDIAEIRRDLVGYADAPPHPRWPGDARIAVTFSLNVEGGAESTLANGDDGSEAMLNDIGYPAKTGVRIPLVESVFEYGSRVGAWRLLRIFREFDVRVSVLAVGRAAELAPGLIRAYAEAGHEIVSHGYRWIDYADVPEAIERDHITKAVAAIEAATGARPQGWMTGRPGPNTRRLVAAHGGFLYDRDYLGDELPFYTRTAAGAPHLVVPYSYETNDNRCNESSGFATSDHFFTYMRDAFDLLYAEGETAPKILSIGLHDRLIGRPARAPGLIRLLEHMRRFDRVWFARGIDIAQHWLATHPPSH